MLDELIDRYGEGAILTARPYVLDSGETLRWIVAIDGVDVPDVDVRIQEHPDHPDVSVMLLVHGGEEVELARWHEDAEGRYSVKAGARYHSGGPGIVETLAGLRRRLLNA